jgi:hypothetical protein
MHVAGNGNADGHLDIDVDFGPGAMAAERLLHLRALFAGQATTGPRSAAGSIAGSSFLTTAPAFRSSATSFLIVGPFSAGIGVLVIGAIFAFGLLG